MKQAKPILALLLSALVLLSCGMLGAGAVQPQEPLTASAAEAQAQAAAQRNAQTAARTQAQVRQKSPALVTNFTQNAPQAETYPNLETHGRFVVSGTTLVEILPSNPVNPNEVITVPDNLGLTNVAPFVFLDSCQRIILPEGITRLECNAFNWESDVSEVWLPDSIEYIGQAEFYGKYLQKDGTPYAADASGIIYIGKTAYAASSIPPNTNLILRDGTLCIGYGLLGGGNGGYKSEFGAENVLSLTIPDSVTIIGSYAFEKCTNLQSVTIPDSVTEIMGGAFIRSEWDPDLQEIVYSSPVIYCNKGSAANIYAAENGIPCVLLDAPNFTVTYVYTDYHTYSEDEDYTLVVANPVNFKTLYYPPFSKTFAGWSESSGAAQADYLPGASVTFTTDKTLYAVWNPAEAISFGQTKNMTEGSSYDNIYTYRYEAEESRFIKIQASGEVGMTLYSSAEESLAYGSCSDDNNEPIIFEVTAGKTYYIQVSLYNGSATLTLSTPFILTYDDNYGANETYSEPEPTQIYESRYRYGYEFLGWATTRTGTVAYQYGDSIALTGNLILYAIWKASPALPQQVVFAAGESNDTRTYLLNSGVGGTYSIYIYNDRIRAGYESISDANRTKLPSSPHNISDGVWRVDYTLEPNTQYIVDVWCYYTDPISQTVRFSFNQPYQETTYALTVTGGSGSGNYASGATVTITANAAPAGQVFDKWVLSSGTGTIIAPGSASTTFKMAASAATVKATYKNTQAVDSKECFKLWGKPTNWEKTPFNWFLLIVCFGWIWMAF